MHAVVVCVWLDVSDLLLGVWLCCLDFAGCLDGAVSLLVVC